MDKNGYIASLSYGKDSLAMLEAIKILGKPLTNIVTVDVWFDRETPADIPELYEFKQRMDKVILERYGIVVDHISNLNANRYTTFVEGALSVAKKSSYGDNCIQGFPGMKVMHWCNSMKRDCLMKYNSQHKGAYEYIGFAADEAERAERFSRKTATFPLIEIGWTEADCMEWCRQNDMLSPVYEMGSKRDGCWFCPFQPLNNLRWIYKSYPHLWEKLLNLDTEISRRKHEPREYCVRHSIMEYDQRFRMEGEGLLNEDDRAFKWSMLDGEYQLKIKF